MAEEYLSIDTDNLDLVAQEIRSKGGTNSTLSFPAGFVSAIQNITTEKTVSPKITATTTTLTPTSTSTSIAAGFHDGTDIIKINVQDPPSAITPGTTAQTVTATSGKFLPYVPVNAIPTSLGYTVTDGTWTTSSATKFSLSGLGFTPTGFLMMLQSYSSSSAVEKIASLSSFANGTTIGTRGDSNMASLNGSKATVTLSSGSVSYNARGDTTNNPSTNKFAGTYYYVVWGR